MSEEEDYNGALTCNEELKEMYNKIGDMLFNLGRENPAKLSYFKAAGVVRDPQKQRDAMLMAYNTFVGNPNNNAIQQIDISEQQQRKGYLNGIIGDIIDL
ncbi:hypothetical protein ACE5D9_06710 [Rickettsia sp. 2024-CO-Wats]|uniref:hypothetical protein n=1 Tax=unclassified Rickettsia TaxID=114295 RepID=UPI00370D5DE4